MNMNHQSSEDIVDRAARAIREVPIPPAPPDDAVLSHIHSEEAGRPQPSLTLWNRIRNMPRYMRYSIVASLAVFALLFVLAQDRHSLALADVTEAIQEYKIVRYQEQMDMIDGPTVQNVVTLDMNLLHMRMEMTHEDEVAITIMDFENRVMLGLHPGQNMAMRMPLVGTRTSAESFLALIRELQEHPETVRTEEDLDGVPAIVFRLTTEEETRTDREGYEGVPVGGPYRTTIWVDPETSLPLMIENYFKGPDRDRYTIDSNFEWDPEVADDVFSTDPPAGYTLQEIPVADPPADQ
jgi:outer membrane lipoprotein-sorting protein